MAKSVIEIDVNDAKFKAFVAAFEQFQDAIGEAEDKVEDLGDGLDDAADRGLKGFARFRKELNDMKVAAKDAIEPLSRIANKTKEIYSSVTGTALGLAKWVTFSALVSGFGLAGLASSVVGTRREALGYGVSPGALRSARAAYGQYADSDSLLSSISQTQFDPTKGAAYSLLGITGQSNKSPIQLLAEVLEKGAGAYGRYKNNPGAMDILSPLLSAEQGRMLSGLNPGEISGAARKQRELQQQYEKSDQGFRKLWQALQESGQAIETSLIGGLNKLAPALSKLTNTVTKVIQQFLDSPRFEKLMDRMGGYVEKFISYITDPKFGEDLTRLKNLIFDLAEGVASLVAILKFIPKVAEGIAKSNIITAPLYWEKKAWDWLTKPMAERLHNPGNLKNPGSDGSGESSFQSFKSDDDGLRAMSAQIGRYYNKQHLDTIQKVLGRYAAGDPRLPDYVKNVSSRTGFAPGQPLDLNDMATRSSLMSAMTKQENSRSNFSAPAIKVIIENNTGGSAVATANSLYTGNAK